QWAQYDRIWDAGRAPAADFVTIWPAMKEETARFIEEVVVNGNGGLRDLLTAPYTIINPTLATYYGGGYTAPGGGGWGKVPRPAHDARRDTAGRQLCGRPPRDLRLRRRRRLGLPGRHAPPGAGRRPGQPARLRGQPGGRAELRVANGAVASRMARDLRRNYGV